MKLTKILIIAGAFALIQIGAIAAAQETDKKGWASSYANYKEYLLLKDTPYDEVGRRYNIDPGLLYAITLAESATGSGVKGYAQPWPYTIRTIDGRVYRYTTREAAIRRLRLEAKKTESIDIGIAQINYKWHKHMVKDPVELFDVKKSLEIVASILSKNMKRNDPLHYQIGRYNSSRPSIYAKYGKKIIDIWNGVIHQENLLRMRTSKE